MSGAVSSVCGGNRFQLHHGSVTPAILFARQITDCAMQFLFSFGRDSAGPHVETLSSYANQCFGMGRQIPYPL